MIPVMRWCRSGRWWFAVALWLAAAHVYAEGAPADGTNPALQRAERAIEALDFAVAARELEGAWRQEHNPRDTVLRILELRGVVAASLGQPDKARRHFEQLLALDGSRVLPGDVSPRILTPFYEARSRALEQGAVELRPERAPQGSGEATNELAVRVVDPTRLGATVRFHWRADGGPWLEALVPVRRARAATQASGSRIEWWAELLGPAQCQLLLAASEDIPFRRGAGTPTAAPAEPTLSSSSSTTDERFSASRTSSPDASSRRTETAAPSARSASSRRLEVDDLRDDTPRAERLTPSPLSVGAHSRPMAPATSSLPRTLGFVGLGVGTGAAMAGGTFLWLASRGRAEIAEAERDAQTGRITGMTQVRAFELAARAQRNEVLGKVLLGAGAGLALGGGALLLFGSGATQVTATPTGVAVGGELP